MMDVVGSWMFGILVEKFREYGDCFFEFVSFQVHNNSVFDAVGNQLERSSDPNASQDLKVSLIRHWFDSAVILRPCLEVVGPQFEVAFFLFL